MISRRLAIATLALGALGTAGCHEVFPQRTEGEKLYRKLCAGCHGTTGAGNTPRFMGVHEADLLDDRWVHGGSEGAIKQVIREGVIGRMPANPQLTAEEVDALFEHLMTLRERAR